MKCGIVLSNSFPKKIRFFDTILRDGGQTPGVSITPEKKLRIAVSPDKMGVAVIEAGSAAASGGEMSAIKLVAKEGLEAEVFSTAKGVRRDIDAERVRMNVIMTNHNKLKSKEAS